MQQDTSQTAARSILLVDDDQVVLDTLGSGLRQARYDVIPCRTGRDALDAYSRSAPDVAIVDIGLPDIGGTALAEQLLARRYRPILILSSRSDPEWVDRAICSGAVGYLVKPLSPTQLIPSIETSCARFGAISEHIAGRFGQGKMTEAQLQTFVDQLPFGVVVVDREHRIMLKNRTADKFMCGERPLSDANGRLATGRNKSAKAMLDRSLGTLSERPGPAAFSMRDDETGDTIQMLAMPLPPPTPGIDGSAAVIIYDSALRHQAPAFLLKSLYGLTEKESRLALALGGGMTVAEYCEKVHVTLNTARTHLKSIYRKTLTSRQGELIALLSRLYVVEDDA